MRIYLATPQSIHSFIDKHATDGRYILDTYHDLKTKKDTSWIGRCKDFMLDSGAYTYMRGNANPAGVDWEKYIDQYAAFVVRHGIRHYFELDIDVIVGFANVQLLTARLNKKVGYPCLPVWHRRRGLEEYARMVHDHDYAAISASGNNNSSEWTRGTGGPQVLATLLAKARRANCRIHGLGYTKIKELRRLPFYSVDSTAWVRGIYGNVYRFNPNRETCFDKVTKPAGHRMATHATQRHNWQQWLYFQEWAEHHL